MRKMRCSWYNASPRATKGETCATPDDRKEKHHSAIDVSEFKNYFFFEKMKNSPRSESQKKIDGRVLPCIRHNIWLVVQLFFLHNVRHGRATLSDVNALKSAQVSSCAYVSIESSVPYEPTWRLFVRSIVRSAVLELSVVLNLCDPSSDRSRS